MPRAGWSKGLSLPILRSLPADLALFPLVSTPNPLLRRVKTLFRTKGLRFCARGMKSLSFVVAMRFFSLVLLKVLRLDSLRPFPCDWSAACGAPQEPSTHTRTRFFPCTVPLRSMRLQKFRENPFFSNAELWREWDSAEGQVGQIQRVENSAGRWEEGFEWCAPAPRSSREDALAFSVYGME